jgi:hypothetical protein
MNASQYTIRQSRPNPFFAAGAALLVSTLVLGSVIRLFAGDVPAPAASIVVQQQASDRA